MKNNIFTVFVVGFFLVVCSTVFANEYLLDFKKACSTSGSELQYECEAAIDSKHYIYLESGEWGVRTQEGIKMATLKLLREDENILVLEQHTVYSGNQLIYIMKKNNQFYLVQVAYSDILENNETTTKQGIFIKTK